MVRKRLKSIQYEKSNKKLQFIANILPNVVPPGVSLLGSNSPHSALCLKMTSTYFFISKEEKAEWENRNPS